jgi:hypothetical protein
MRNDLARRSLLNGPECLSIRPVNDIKSREPFTGLHRSMRFKPLIISVYRFQQMQGGGRADDLLYFKCPTTKQMRCLVRAYKSGMPNCTRRSSDKIKLR